MQKEHPPYPPLVRGKEQEIQEDGCRYRCYLKGNRVYCAKTDKHCYPMPFLEETPSIRDAYITSLSPELQIGYGVLRKQFEQGKRRRDDKSLQNFYNYVRPNAYVYGSPRPVPLGVGKVIEVIHVDMYAEGWDWIDILITPRKLTPKIVDDYELTPLSMKAQFFFKISNLIRYKVVEDREELSEYRESYDDVQKWESGRFTYKMAVQDFMRYGREYFEKRYKTTGKYPITQYVAMNLLEQIGIIR